MADSSPGGAGKTVPCAGDERPRHERQRLLDEVAALAADPDDLQAAERALRDMEALGPQ